MKLIQSPSPSARLLGSLACGLGLALLVASNGCSSDDTSSDMPPATGTDGGAGAASTGAAGGGMAGSAASEAGTAGSGGSAGAGSTSDAGLCAHPQMASDIGDHCDVDGGGTLKQPATTCPAAGDAAAGQSGDGGMPFSHSGTFTDDDDCKYDVSYGAACVGVTTTFDVMLKSRATGMPVTGANPHIEVTSQDTPSHKLPTSPKPVTTEVGNGEYKISNVPLDLDGFWTVRFTFFDDCANTEATSKHGGVSFTVIMR